MKIAFIILEYLCRDKPPFYTFESYYNMVQINTILALNSDG